MARDQGAALVLNLMDREDRAALGAIASGALGILFTVVAIPFLALGLGLLVGVVYRGFMLTCGC